MNKVGLILCGISLAAGLSLVWFLFGDVFASSTHTFRGQPITPMQIAQGQEVYAANCASCHGANLEGQQNWRRRLDNGRLPAPPHDETGHTWHHSDRILFTITKLGVAAIVSDYQSDMPAFAEVLTDDEITTVLAYIKSTWPERQRASQDRITAQDRITGQDRISGKDKVGS